MTQFDSMRDLFLGWDVGAWSCDRNPVSRDALVALQMHGSQLVVVGNPRRCNLRCELEKYNGLDLVAGLLAQVGITPGEPRCHVTIAIDTPLGWPAAMVDLVTKCVAAPREHIDKYLYRSQELDLRKRTRYSPRDPDSAKLKCRPLSMVRDMIGSQSTKGIHFVNKAGLEQHSVGVWSRGSTVAIETYPAAALNREIDELTSSMMKVITLQNRGRGEAWRGDVRDALICAIIASYHRMKLGLLESPMPDAIANEGWIWLPALPRRNSDTLPPR